jgi:ketosteroid isomerase-like protein
VNTQHTIERVSDELAIRAVLDEYCLRLEINDFEEWLDLFTDDSVYEVFRRELKGRDEIRAMLSQAPHGIHIGGAARIAIEGNRAETTQNYVFIGNDPAHNNQGWYFRTLVRDGATWKIAHTRVKLSK